MDLAAHLREQAQHLIRMADQPAFRQHAALRLEELQASDPIYETLPDVIAQERARMREESSDAARHQELVPGSDRRGRLRAAGA